MIILQRVSLEVIFSVVLGLGFGVSVAQAQVALPPPAATGAGNLEPPTSAVNGSGNPTASTPTQPSWDQWLRADNGGVDGCNSTRFKCIWPTGQFGAHPNGAAVLDKETGRVWERTPDSVLHVWESRAVAPVDARRHCALRGTGGRLGWRLPSLIELQSLILPNGQIPGDHPFTIPAEIEHWSSTTVADEPEKAWTAAAGFVRIETVTKNRSRRVWCVRGGGGLSEY